MIVTISPASSQFEETLNTLKYANRAKNIKTNAKKNKKLIKYNAEQYNEIVNDLKEEVDKLKTQLLQ